MWYHVTRVILEAAIVAGLVWALVLSPQVQAPVELRQIYTQVGPDVVCTFMTTTYGGVLAGECIDTGAFVGGFGTFQDNLRE